MSPEKEHNMFKNVLSSLLPRKMLYVALCIKTVFLNDRTQ